MHFSSLLVSISALRLAECLISTYRSKIICLLVAIIFAFSIDIAAALGLCCNGVNEEVTKRLYYLQDRMYAGYCFLKLTMKSLYLNHVFHSINVWQPIQLGLAIPYPKTLYYALPSMCAVTSRLRARKASTVLQAVAVEYMLPSNPLRRVCTCTDRATRLLWYPS
ncbi:hypothetical protein IW262DRAFT_1354062 [Armillaria fumosa]|nr:hypothetical protein IW262DRAFT_1354062 [Armillaria fumosa]